MARADMKWTDEEECYLAHYMYDQTVSELALVLGRSETAVKNKRALLTTDQKWRWQKHINEPRPPKRTALDVTDERRFKFYSEEEMAILVQFYPESLFTDEDKESAIKVSEALGRTPDSVRNKYYKLKANPDEFDRLLFVYIDDIAERKGLI